MGSHHFLVTRICGRTKGRDFASVIRSPQIRWDLEQVAIILHALTCCSHIQGGPGLIRWRPLLKRPPGGLAEAIMSLQEMVKQALNEKAALPTFWIQPWDTWNNGQLSSLWMADTFRNREKRLDYKVCGGFQETSTATAHSGSPS